MPITFIKPLAALLALLAVALAAYLFGVRTSRPVRESITPAPAQSLPDGALLLARVPAASAPQVPRALLQDVQRLGGTLERTIHATLRPRVASSASAPSSTASAPHAADCPPVSMDLALLRTQEGRRVLAASPDGEVLGGMDVPLVATALPAEHPWAAGLSMGSDGSPGIFLERDLGRLRVGAEAIRQAPDHQIGARVRLGWSW